MKKKIKLPTHAEIHYNDRRCGEKCQFLIPTEWETHEPFRMLGGKCMLFHINLICHTVDDSNGAERHKLMIDKNQWHFESDRCEECIKLTKGD